MPTTNIRYREPATGQIKTIPVDLKLESSRDSFSDEVVSTITATATGFTGDSGTIADVTEIVEMLLYGNGMKAAPGWHMTRLTAAESGSSPSDVLLGVENSGPSTAALPLGLNAEVGDPIAIVSQSDEAGAPLSIKYRLIATIPNGTSITVNATLTQSFLEGALVFNLANRLPKYLTGRGVNKRSGLRSYLEAPNFSAPTVVWQASPAGFLITFPDDEDSVLTPSIYRAYIRDSADERFEIEPHWVPDLETTTLGSGVLATTYKGGSSAGGGVLVPASEYHFLFSRATNTGGNSVPQTLKSSSGRLTMIAV